MWLDYTQRVGRFNLNPCECRHASWTKSWARRPDHHPCRHKLVTYLLGLFEVELCYPEEEFWLQHLPPGLQEAEPFLVLCC